MTELLKAAIASGQVSAAQIEAHQAAGELPITMEQTEFERIEAHIDMCSDVAQQAESTVCEVSHKQMFEAACVDLGLINEALGIDPDGGGAKPIIEAINTLKKRAAQGERLAIAVMSDNGNMFVG